MPIHAAAKRLRREIESGKIKKECPCTHTTPEKKCPCPKIKTKDPKAVSKCTCVGPT
jgi:hypothetical protein